MRAIRPSASNGNDQAAETSPQTAIHWAAAVNGQFDVGSNWTGGVVPGAGDDAILDAAGGPFTVSAQGGETVGSVRLTANATLVTVGVFTATNGTGAGANAGLILDQGEFVIGGNIENSGTIVTESFSKTGGSFLNIATNATLSGGGSLEFEDIGPQNSHQTRIVMEIGSASNPVTLTNVDNTIAPLGLKGSPAFEEITVGQGSALINEAAGTISVDGSVDNRLTLTAAAKDGSWSLVNDGTLEATNRAPLAFVGATVSGSGGQIIANSAASVGFQGGSVSGQTISTDSQGVISFVDCPVTLSGNIVNVGGIVFSATNKTTLLTLTGNTSISGGDIHSGDGEVTLSGGSIVAGAFPVTLTNADNLISGGGRIGSKQMTLVNGAAAYIYAQFAETLVLNTGKHAIGNAGVLYAAGTLKIVSAVDNSGTLVAAGTLIAKGDVTGSGSAQISNGVMSFAGAFTENVAFIGTTGSLVLAKSQTYDGAISGFSAAGATSLDLKDIAFVSPAEATYSGTADAGVLTVSDGRHTATIDMTGDYLGATFVASSDGHKGVTIVASTTVEPASAAILPAHTLKFATAMAQMGAVPSASTVAHAPWSPSMNMLAGPRVALA